VVDFSGGRFLSHFGTLTSYLDEKINSNHVEKDIIL